MKATLFSLLMVLLAFAKIHAQGTTNISVQKDTLTQEQKDSVHDALMEKMMSYPYIKGTKGAGVLPVQDIDEKQDPKLQYRLLFLIPFADKNKMQKINPGLFEVARALNLHAAAGIPESNIHGVVIIFKTGLNALLKDEIYKEKYKSSNPNTALIEELQKAGVTIIGCGQSMMNAEIKKGDLLPGVKVSLSARTAISYYSIIGYVMQ